MGVRAGCGVFSGGTMKTMRQRSVRDSIVANATREGARAEHLALKDQATFIPPLTRRRGGVAAEEEGSRPTPVRHSLTALRAAEPRENVQSPAAANTARRRRSRGEEGRGRPR